MLLALPPSGCAVCEEEGGPEAGNGVEGVGSEGSAGVVWFLLPW